MTILSTGVATDFINFSRASNATVTDSNGVIKWARHNLLLASEQFDASNWSKSASPVITANSAVAPNGTTTADKLANGNGLQSSITQVITKDAAPITYTAGVFVKPSGWNWVQIAFYDTVSLGYRFWFDVQNGVKGSSIAIGAGYTNTSFAITAVGNGWYYCTITATTSSAASNLLYIYSANADAVQTNGNGTDGILIWGAHLYRSDMGMQANTSAYPMYNPTTPKNLLGFTENFENAGWSKSNTAVTANAITAPNGLQTADLFVQTSGTTGGSIFQSSGPTWTSNSMVLFNLATGTVGTVTAGSFTSTSITSVGDGWYRCAAVKDGYTLSFYGKAGAWSSVALQTFSSEKMRLYPSTSSTAQTGTGDGTSGIYIWGAQLSDSASLDPYVANHFAAPSAAAYYGPRLDYDPVTLAAKGLLVEEQRTNLFVRSEEFDNVNWAPTGATISANTTAAPSGVVSAETLVEDTSSGFHRVYQSVTCSISTTYTLSVFVKAAGRTQARILETTLGGAFFDLSSATVLSTDAGVTASIQSVGNGWYRCRITATTSGAQTVFVAQVQSGLAASATYIGTGIAALYLYGAQLEAGSFATSYIPTTSATVTRSADVASVGTAAFPYSATEGTLVVAWQLAQLSGSPAAIHLTDAAENNRIRINAHLAGVNRSTITAAGALVDNIDTSTAATGITKYALGGKSADYAVYRNGSAGGTSTNAGFPSGCTEMRIGRDTATGNFNGHIRQITYIPRRLSNAELQTRTA